MTPNEVTEVLRESILILTPVKEAIYFWPNNPRPDNHYASVGINAMVQVGYGEHSSVNDSGEDIDRSFATLFDITIGVDFFRTDAMYSAALLSAGLIKQETIDLWNFNEIGLVERSNIRDLTAVINSSFEDRAQIDITIQALITPPVEKILGVNAVRVKGDVYNHGGQVAEIDITVADDAA